MPRLMLTEVIFIEVGDDYMSSNPVEVITDAVSAVVTEPVRTDVRWCGGGKRSAQRRSPKATKR